MMKNKNIMLLSALLVLSIAINECLIATKSYYFETGLWVILLTAAIVFASIIMVKHKKIILPKLLVLATMVLRYIVIIIILAITSMKNTLDPVLILIDIIFKTAVVIIPAFIIYGIVVAVNHIKTLRKIK